MEEETQDSILFDRAFLGRDEAYKRFIAIFSCLIKINHFNIADDTALIKQELEVLINKNSDETDIYPEVVENFKFKLRTLFIKFGVVMDENSSMTEYHNVLKIINFIEESDYNLLTFYEDIRNSMVSDEEVMIDLMNHVIVEYNMVDALECIDLTELFFDNMNEIISSKEKVKISVNTEMYLKLIGYVSVIPTLTETVIFKDVYTGKENMPMDIDIHFNVIREDLEFRCSTTEKVDILREIVAIVILYGGTDRVEHFLSEKFINDLTKNIDFIYASYVDEIRVYINKLKDQG